MAHARGWDCQGADHENGEKSNGHVYRADEAFQVLILTLVIGLVEYSLGKEHQVVDRHHEDVVELLVFRLTLEQVQKYTNDRTYEFAQK